MDNRERERVAQHVAKVARDTVGFLGGVSIAERETILERVCDLLKEGPPSQDAERPTYARGRTGPARGRTRP